ncbi:MAG: hypothetical protein QNJ36_00025 [Calothrix sp. MO_167.B42]|nr:hypothetical protein [Calothrix sp. MO_167.B42]
MGEDGAGDVLQKPLRDRMLLVISSTWKEETVMRGEVNSEIIQGDDVVI